MTMHFPTHTKTFHLKRELTPSDLREGKYSFLIKSDRIQDCLVEALAYHYPYPNITLKVFKAEAPISSFRWGSEADEAGTSNDLVTCTKIQNQLHFYGLAPRVWDLVYLETHERKYVCQVTEQVLGRELRDRKLIAWFFRTMQYLLDELGIEVNHEDYQPGNVVGFKWVDFQGMRYKDTAALEKKLLERVDAVAGWGPADDTYQSIECLGHTGRRQTAQRIELLQLPTEDFVGRSVLDLGCGAGMMADYASARGARYVAGVDMPEIARVAQDLANHLGVFNVNYFGYDIADPAFLEYMQSKQNSFDIVFYLAMRRHIGYPSQVNSLVKHILYFEGNGETDAAAQQLIDEFRKYFPEVTLLGFSEDFGRRALLRCER